MSEATSSKPLKASVATAADATATPSVKKNKKNKLIRPRGKRGGVKNRKPSDKKDSTKGKANVGKSAKGNVVASDAAKAAVKGKAPSKKALAEDGAAAAADPADADASASTPHSIRIARYHALEREFHSPATTEDRRAEILVEQEAMGGIEAYQDDSALGADKQRGGESGKWLVGALEKTRGKKKEKLRLLDVGALTGTAYAAYPWLDVTSIDINPRAPHVIQSDFFDFEPPSGEEENPPYDVVSLSLVVNFIGDLHKRGAALIRAHEFLGPKGYLYLVLPLACVQSSRYLTHDRLREILDSCGWVVCEQSDSSKLTRWLLQRKQPHTKAKWDGKVWKKQEVRVAVKANNFCIRVGEQSS